MTTYAQRAADLAEAVAEHDALAARRTRGLRLGRAVLPEDVVALGTLRARIRRLRPHTLLWRATLAGGATVAVETRDRIDFADDTSLFKVTTTPKSLIPDPSCFFCHCLASASLDKYLVLQEPQTLTADLIGQNFSWPHA